MLKIMSGSGQSIVSGFEVLRILIDRHAELKPEIEALMNGVEV